MAKFVTHIELTDEDSGVTEIVTSLTRLVDAVGATNRGMNPGEIVLALTQIDPDDLDDVMQELQKHHDENIVGAD